MSGIVHIASLRIRSCLLGQVDGVEPGLVIERFQDKGHRPVVTRAKTSSLWGHGVPMFQGTSLSIAVLLQDFSVQVNGFCMNGSKKMKVAHRI